VCRDEPRRRENVTKVALTTCARAERAQPVYSARLHSRGIGSVRAVRPLVPGDGGKSGERSRGPRTKRWLQVHLASQTARALAGGSNGSWGEPLSRESVRKIALTTCDLRTRGGSRCTVLHRLPWLTWQSLPTA
jgi:hypothetical protein